MSLDSPPAAVPGAGSPDQPEIPPPGVIALFLAFAKMSLAGFGGVLAFARRGIVEEHRWMTADEFNETFALCHFLPGPNIVNLSVVFGARFARGRRRDRGLCRVGRPAMVLMTVLAVLYAHYGEIDALRRILAGISCGAVGLLLAEVAQMMVPLVRRRDLGRT